MYLSFPSLTQFTKFPELNFIYELLRVLNSESNLREKERRGEERKRGKEKRNEQEKIKIEESKGKERRKKDESTGENKGRRK